MNHRIPFLFALCALALGSACGPADRAEECTEILEAHLEHENAMLDILERQRGDPAAAERALKAYLSEESQALADLEAKRRQLEADPTALAAAMRDLEPKLKRVFERRRALAEAFPELMAREEVRTAFSALDPL